MSHIPRWPSVRSRLGGLPVPRGWRLIERETEGYRLYEVYESPKGVTYEQAVVWYLVRFPEGKAWGGWRACLGIGGSGDAGLYAQPENWAWRNPRNHHLLQIGVGGSNSTRVTVGLSRSEFGDDCYF